MAHTCDPRTWEEEEIRRSKVQGHPRLHSEFRAILGYKIKSKLKNVFSFEVYTKCFDCLSSWLSMSSSVPWNLAELWWPQARKYEVPSGPLGWSAGPSAMFIELGCLKLQAHSALAGITEHACTLTQDLCATPLLAGSMLFCGVLARALRQSGSGLASHLRHKPLLSPH